MTLDNFKVETSITTSIQTILIDTYITDMASINYYNTSLTDTSNARQEIKFEISIYYETIGPATEYRLRRAPCGKLPQRQVLTMEFELFTS